MELYTVIENLELFNDIILWVVFIILPAFVGSYASDYFKTLSKENMRLSIKRIFLATVIAVIITQVFLDWLIYTDRRAILPFTSLVLGLLGFELLHGMSSLENMVSLIKRLSLLISPIVGLIRQVNEVRSVLASQKQDPDNDDNTKDSKTPKK